MVWLWAQTLGFPILATTFRRACKRKQSFGSLSMAMAISMAIKTKQKKSLHVFARAIAFRSFNFNKTTELYDKTSHHSKSSFNLTLIPDHKTLRLRSWERFEHQYPGCTRRWRWRLVRNPVLALACPLQESNCHHQLYIGQTATMTNVTLH